MYPSQELNLPPSWGLHVAFEPPVNASWVLSVNHPVNTSFAKQCNLTDTLNFSTVDFFYYACFLFMLAFLVLTTIEFIN
jgi:hypothetical protein